MHRTLSRVILAASLALTAPAAQVLDRRRSVTGWLTGAQEATE